MITIILQKVLSELGQENPKLDYIRGMVEVLLASQEKPTEQEKPKKIMSRDEIAAEILKNGFTAPYIPKTEMTEGDLMNQEAAAKLKVVKELGKLE